MNEISTFADKNSRITIIMDEETKNKLLEGLDEYYAQRTDVLAGNDLPQKTIVINGFTHMLVDSTIDEWAKCVGAVDIADIQWVK